MTHKRTEKQEVKRNIFNWPDLIGFTPTICPYVWDFGCFVNTPRAWRSKWMWRMNKLMLSNLFTAQTVSCQLRMNTFCFKVLVLEEPVRHIFLICSECFPPLRVASKRSCRRMQRWGGLQWRFLWSSVSFKQACVWGGGCALLCIYSSPFHSHLGFQSMLGVVVHLDSY